MGQTLVDRPNAVVGDPPDDTVAGHYGNPLREQRALATEVGLVDRSHRGILAVRGPDRLGWLHSLTSQQLADIAPGTGTEALVLSPHGHVEHHLVVADDGETTWLDVEPATAAHLLSYLDSMRFLLRVEPADVTDSWAVLTILGPDGAEALAAAGIVVEGLAAYDVRPIDGGGLVRRLPWPGGHTVDLIVPRPSLDGWASRLGVPLAGHDAFEALRVEARRPRLGKETDHRTIPHEVGWIGTAVHLDKGCYRGQETVARVHNLGRPPRRLVFLHLDGSEVRLPGSGDPVTAEGRTVGFVGTAVRHHELGPVALALVKRATPDEGELLAGGVPAKAERVVDQSPQSVRG